MKLVVLRGLPGCGKSTYIREHFPGATPAPLAPEGWSPVIISGDHFFTHRPTGEYRFDHTKFGEAHAMAICYAVRAMRAKVPVIIADNTNVRRWEWSVLATVAESFGYEVEEVDLFDGGKTDDELATRNLHAVPLEVIQGMRSKWEK